MQAGEIRGIVVIPVDFAQLLARQDSKAPIQVITDGSEPNTANFVQAYTKGGLANLVTATSFKSRHSTATIN